VLNLLLIIAASYVLGSFPTGIIAGKLARGVDIRTQGSGNTGATNSFRVLGWKVGIVVALIDIAKGLAATAFLTRIAVFQEQSLPASVLFIVSTLAAVVGHIKPIFAGFKGGKGFGTAAGAITGAYPVLAPFCLGLFLLTLTLSGNVAFCAAVTMFGLPLFYILAVHLFGVAWDPVTLGFFIFAFFLTLYSVRKKLVPYFKGEAELFTKVMIFKLKK